MSHILSDVLRRSKQRPGPKMTAVVSVVVAVLSWVSTYPGGQIKDWQLPALGAAALSAGLLVMNQSGAALKKGK
jgi:hypothetical protein